MNDHTLPFIGRESRQLVVGIKQRKERTNRWRPLVKERESDKSPCDTFQMRVLENQLCLSVRGDQVSIVWETSCTTWGLRLTYVGPKSEKAPIKTRHVTRQHKFD